MILAQTAGELERRYPTAGGPDEAGTYPSLEHLRVLVVDDEPDSNEVVSAVLASCGAEVRVAGSAAEGLDEVQRWMPDVIISDVGMPGEDGYAFVAKLRAQPGKIGRIPATGAHRVRDDRGPRSDLLRRFPGARRQADRRRRAGRRGREHGGPGEGGGALIADRAGVIARSMPLALERTSR